MRKKPIRPTVGWAVGGDRRTQSARRDPRAPVAMPRSPTARRRSPSLRLDWLEIGIPDPWHVEATFNLRSQ